MTLRENAGCRAFEERAKKRWRLKEWERWSERERERQDANVKFHINYSIIHMFCLLYGYLRMDVEYVYFVSVLYNLFILTEITLDLKCNVCFAPRLLPFIFVLVTPFHYFVWYDSILFRRSIGCLGFFRVSVFVYESPCLSLSLFSSISFRKLWKVNSSKLATGKWE